MQRRRKHRWTQSRRSSRKPCAAPHCAAVHFLRRQVPGFSRRVSCGSMKMHKCSYKPLPCLLAGQRFLSAARGFRPSVLPRVRQPGCGRSRGTPKEAVLRLRKKAEGSIKSGTAQNAVPQGNAVYRFRCRLLPAGTHRAELPGRHCGASAMLSFREQAGNGIEKPCDLRAGKRAAAVGI